MKKRFGIFAGIVFTCAIAGLSAFAISGRGSRAEAAPEWEVSGIFSEACECNPPCPCWSGKEPTQHHCHNVQIYKIENGRYGAVRLDGLVVVVAWVSPEGAVMDQSAGNSVLVALYVDRSTSVAQQQALGKIWRQSFLQGLEGRKGDLKAVRFQTAEVGPDRAIVVIPKILTFNVTRGSEQPMHSPMPQIRHLRVATSVSYRYSDYGMSWNYPGRHAAFATFHAKSSPSAD